MARERVAQWMIDNGFATGHGDSLEDLLRELQWQVTELRVRARERYTEGPRGLPEARTESLEG
jgi:hypothetical protein